MRAISRRNFARLLAVGGSTALVSRPALASLAQEYRLSDGLVTDPLPSVPAAPDEEFWAAVKAQFVMPRELASMNAANLCPSSTRVLEALYDHTRDIDQDPSPQNRMKMREGKEATRKLLADFLRVTPEQIVITRNTSEANNMVSSGLDLGPGDEVIILSDNHPSNHAAWRAKAKRFGFSVEIVEQVNPHPGPDYYVDALTRRMTTHTKVLAFTHVTNTAGDLFPAKELCHAARERGVLTLVDGAQSFGVLDVDLGDMQPDFYAGSAHKWPCGPKESGVLFVNQSAHSRISPSIVSVYAGAVGISTTMEAMGQRDLPAIIAFGEAVKFQMEIGLPKIERRARELAQALKEGLRQLDDVKLWTHFDAERSAAVVSLLPGNLDPRKLAAALYEDHRIICAVRGGRDRGGIRFSPHMYNLHEEVDRALAAVKRYMEIGV